MIDYFFSLDFFNEVKRQYLTFITMSVLCFPFLRKRKGLAWRLPLVLVLIFGVAVTTGLLSFIESDFFLWGVILYSVPLIFDFFLYWFLFETDPVDLLYRNLIANAIGTISGMLFGKMIGDVLFPDQETNYLAYALYQAITSVLVVTPFAAIFRKQLKDDVSVLIGSKTSSAIFYGILFYFFYAVSVLSYAIYYFIEEGMIRYFGFIAVLLSSAVIMALLFEIQRAIQLHKDKTLIEKMWYDDRKRYEIQKETIESINFKCHDLRHQIRALTQNGVPNEKHLKEIEQSLNIYDSFAKTGNPALDVVFSDCGLRCQKNEIQLTYIIDGEALSFVEEIDLYALFGNALENAVDYELTVPKEEGRFIFASVKREDALILIHVENYCAEPLAFRDGLPLTTKGDERWHGFGMKSMQNIVKKYKGKMAVKTESNMFQLDISLPCP